MMKDRNVRHIEWAEMDKSKFYIVGPTMMIGLRLLLYPPMLIKTRLQFQRQNSEYKGTRDAFIKIFRHEGVRGFYKGFATNMFTVGSGQFYITIFEYVRQYLAVNFDDAMRSLIAGACASFAGQTATIPIDIISQKQMIHGRQQVVNTVKGVKKKVKYRSGWSVIKDIYRKEGIPGFYKGYFVSLMTFIPSSAIWWSSYYRFTVFYDKLTPLQTPHLVIQGIAGMSAGITASILTNPIDTVRTRIQIEGGRASVQQVILRLYRDEGKKALGKGLSARLMMSVPSSLIISVGYETVKRLSLKDECR